MAYNINGGCVSIKFLVMGPIENNVYIIGDGSSTLVVDPACDAGRIAGEFGGRELDSIVLTHAHWDHVGAAKALRDLTGARVVASSVDAPVISGERKLDPGHRPFELCAVDLEVADGDTVEVGAMRWEVIETPGHTPGSMCLFLDPQFGAHEGAPVLIAGDTLFAGAHGRTDFVGGDPAAMRTSLQRLADLPDNTIVLPGHNAITTIAREKPWILHQ